MSIKTHEVFVLDVDGKPLTPTTTRKARLLLKAGVAKKVWSKFNTFGIQMLVPTRTEIPSTSMGVDLGTKFEGYSVVCAKENVLNVKLDLPDKKKLVRKIEERRVLSRNRRSRKCRRREARFDNRSRKNFLAPSQRQIDTVYHPSALLVASRVIQDGHIIESPDDEIILALLEHNANPKRYGVKK